MSDEASSNGADIPRAISRHAGQSLGAPDLIELTPQLFTLRFEVMKARSARAALGRLMQEGTIRAGSTVIDSSSGIYACALALACHEFGVHCYIVGSTTIDETLRIQLDLLGAELEQMPPSESLRADQHRRVSRVQELVKAHPEWHWMRQYHDAVHYLGYEPIASVSGHLLLERGYRAVDLVAPVGSGVSSGSLALGLASSGLDVRLVGVQPFGSVTFGSEEVEDPDMLIAGIGSSIEFENVRHDLYHSIHWISYEVGRSGTISLCREHALFAGLSSGAAYAVARYLTQNEAPRDRCVLMTCPDTGHRYLKGIYDDAAKVRDLSSYGPQRLASPGERPRLPWSSVLWGGKVSPVE
ncbi:pyridoxal-phosphate dependent enzyme [Rothia uropygialis]|uniref:pyridoxal-phosphate dependent enzyme n=1 Tax=Kocuria sp. 36 TaxID=1415402 RepID=UPI00101D78E5|nr:pyridoxal-phosphate dependent enzyme [Kocuria sp. 36]